jgi:peptide/nickel transport system permease protein
VLLHALRRLLLAVPLALAAATLLFALLELAPGEPSDVLIGDRPLPPEVRERIERSYGFDRPAGERYLRWLQALCLRGELGWSHSRGRPVAEAVAAALPPTLILAGAALLLHLAAGLAVGVLSAAYVGRWPDRALGALGLAAYAMPTFWLALMAVLGLAYALPLFPAASMRSVGAESWSPLARGADLLWHLALPAAVLGLGSAVAMGRFVRAGLLAALGEDFVRAARARGGSGPRVLLRHALRNALLPAINVLGLSLPMLLSGSLVVEVVFAWPGIGRLTYDAIRAQDVPVILATTLLATLLVVLGSLLADLAMTLADPRVRLDGRGAAS